MTTKLLIAVKSCDYDRARGAHDLLRETWGKNVEHADLLFFTARPMANGADQDEVIVNTPDDYPGLPHKTRAIAKFAVDSNYDYAFLCDTGSYVFFHHLIDYDYYAADYMGYWGLNSEPFYYVAQNTARGCAATHIPKCHPWASGGGYFLSKKALEIVASTEPTVWAEDLGVGQMLAVHNIYLTDRSRQGFKGYIVDWIHGENNSGGLDERRDWMRNLQARDSMCFRAKTCAQMRNPQTRIVKDPVKEMAPKINPTPWDRSTRLR